MIGTIDCHTMKSCYRLLINTPDVVGAINHNMINYAVDYWHLPIWLVRLIDHHIINYPIDY